jgi:hypothetical protein
MCTTARCQPCSEPHESILHLFFQMPSKSILILSSQLHFWCVNCLFSLRLSIKTLYERNSSQLHACYMSHLSHVPSFVHSNSIWWEAWIKKTPIKQTKRLNSTPPTLITGLNCFHGLGIYVHFSSLMITDCLHYLTMEVLQRINSLVRQSRHIDLCSEGFDMLSLGWGARPDGGTNAWTHPEWTLKAVLYVSIDFPLNFTNSPCKILSIILQLLAPLEYT